MLAGKRRERSSLWEQRSAIILPSRGLFRLTGPVAHVDRL